MAERNLQQVLNELFDRVNIADVASALGLQVERREGWPRKAICPFHQDKTPSLNLYRGSGHKDKPHYHCFVCRAHGSVIDLVMKRNNVPFIGAVEWLAHEANIELPNIGATATLRISATTGRQETLDYIHLEGRSEKGKSALESFAKTRMMSSAFLAEHSIAIIDLNRLIERARKDDAFAEALVQGGVARRPDDTNSQPNIWIGNEGLRAFYSGTRLLLPMWDERGELAGFAARSLTKQSLPKYLYSYGFERGKTLYGANELLRNIRDSRASSVGFHVDLYIVEGIFDALRLKKHGLSAVAVLGSSLTQGQIDVVRHIRDACEQKHLSMRIHLFLDNDQAGTKGTYDALRSLMRLTDDGPLIGIDVVRPNSTDEYRSLDAKIDADIFLSNIEEPLVAQARVAAATIVGLRFLAEYECGLYNQGHSKPAGLADLSLFDKAAAARRLAVAFKDIGWARASVCLAGSEQVDTDSSLLAFGELVESYVPAQGPTGQRKLLKSKATKPTSPIHVDDHETLLRALVLGRSSTGRREYPVDDSAWVRLATAASCFYHIHKARLNAADGPASPYIARSIPKDEHRDRLKAGPIPEDALLQQYMLLELLKQRPDTPLFDAQIPAVRYYGDLSPDRPIETTGTGGEPPETVSFAYQVDMRVVRGDIPPHREGLFRPYFECWRSYIDFVDSRLRRMQHDSVVHIVRLDIAGFYDNIRRHIVELALKDSLEAALLQLPEQQGGALSFAPLFDTSKSVAMDRGNAVVSFFLKHSFGFEYFDPQSGERRRSASSDMGIPQGPDLSAYLANISLFSLDQLMRDAIGALDETASNLATDGATAGAIYARYVDDIVLVCHDTSTATRLQRTIENHLATLGLRLNRKNQPIEPMSISDARSWLTDSRTSFGFSGPLADLPMVDALDPLGDAGDINRKTALGLVHDPMLDIPTQNIEEQEGQIEQVLRALQAADLRFNDRANAYRKFWLYASAKSSTSAQLAERFVELLSRTETSTLSVDTEEKRRIETAIISLEALERFLRFCAAAPAILTDAQLSLLNDRGDAVAGCVLSGFFKTLASTLSLSETAQNRFLDRADIQAQCFLILRLSLERIPDGEPNLDLNFSPSAFTRAAHECLRLPLRRYVQIQEPARTIAPRAGGTSLVAIEALHEGIVLLQKYTATTVGALNQRVAEVDPLVPLSARIGKLTDIGAEPVAATAIAILGVWLPQGDGARTGAPNDTQVEMDAASVFINIANKRFVELAPQRPTLLRLLARCENAEPLPNPPGLNLPGIMLWCDHAHLRCVVLTPQGQTTNETIFSLPYPFDAWEETLTTPSGGSAFAVFQAKETYLSGSKPLALNNFSRNDLTPSTIAELYRTLYETCGPKQLQADFSDGERRVLVHTVYSFFGTVSQDGREPTYRLIAWALPESAVGSLAFVRGGTGLEQRSVFRDGAEHWRFGWAFRDLIEHLEAVGESDNSPDAASAMSIVTPELRRRALLVHVLPKLSGRDTHGVGLPGASGTPPTRISRWLELLQMFTVTADAQRDSILLAGAFAEGAFMSERIACRGRLNRPGQASDLLSRSIFRASRGLQRFAEVWPDGSSWRLPSRRSSAAWFALANRLDLSATSIPQFMSRALIVMAEGCRVIGMVDTLRAFALELAATLNERDLSLFAEISVSEKWVSDTLTDEALLYRISTPDAGADGDTGNPKQLRLLMAEFVSMARDQRQLVVGKPSDSITPLGWATIVAMLTGVAPITAVATDWRPRLRVMHEQQRAVESLTKIIDWLARHPASDEPSGATQISIDQWPWDIYVCFGLELSLPKSNIAEGFQTNLCEHLETLDQCAGLSIRDVTAAHLPLGSVDKKAQRRQIVTADGSRHWLHVSQISIARLSGDRRLDLENTVHDHISHYRWTETYDAARLIGLHAVSVECAQISFSRDAPHDARSKDEPSVIAKPHLLEPALATQPPVSDPWAVAEPILPPEQVSADLPSDLWKRQLNAWQQRKRKSASHHRIAMIQWEVNETFSEPDNAGDSADKLDAGKGEELVKIGGSPVTTEKATRSEGSNSRLSITEYRRRRLLLRALDVCNSFEVDGLVLPEYSVRPETVNWLFRQLATRIYPKVLWAGTFRVPSGTTLRADPTSGFVKFDSLLSEVADGHEYHSAVLTCLYQDKSQKWRMVARAKRFPSVAAHEQIRPPLDLEWRPLLDEIKDPLQLGSYALELICSEMFVHASSANFPGVIQATERLMAQYRPMTSSEANITKWITEDIKAFASCTSILGDLKSPLTDRFEKTGHPRRSLVIVPALTSRTADYHVFGQNQHLAAGLVTAFCNAVAMSGAEKIGQGNSCFIGLNGWDATKSKEPPPNPYCGLAPGFFQVGSSKAGPLASNEQAIVIADLDLSNTTDHKPRPHFSNHPMELVAHLPIIFATERKGPSYIQPKRFEGPWNSRTIRYRSLQTPDAEATDASAATTFPLSTFADRMHLFKQVLATYDVERPYIQAHGIFPEPFVKAADQWLRTLELFADDSKWLTERRMHFSPQRGAHRAGAPPAALVDWIWIDDSWPTNIDALAKFTTPDIDDAYLDDNPSLDFRKF